MRLGAYECELLSGSRVNQIYGKDVISERHRHRYEFNNRYRRMFDEAGMCCVGINRKADLVEIIELRDHPWFIGVQFHPEYSSTVLRPHPLFLDFIKAALND